MTLLARLHGRSTIRGRARAIAIAVATLPASALACPVCQDPRDANQGAFLAMTIFMSLLPLSLIGAIVIYLWKKAHEPNESSEVSIEADSSRG